MTKAQRNAVYAKLLNRGTTVGPNLYELSERIVTPAIRVSLALRGRPEETESFYLRPKADVTGNPSDRGWILKDKRPDYMARFGVEPDRAK